MAQVINTNTMSLNAQRNLSTSGASLATTIQRLSSGLRINSAKDDAAGLAISERFSTQIRGLDLAPGNSDDVKVFHAGTKRGEAGELLATGGRVLNVTAMAPTIKEAQARAYAAVDKIDWPGGFCRRDIGWRAIARG